jgi:hypothetical protein
MVIDQRNNGASQTITNGAANVYCLDRWIAFSSGSNITTQQVASGVTGIPYVLQITGAAGNTAAQCSQKIESRNIADLAGSTVTLSALLSNSVNTSMYWFAFYANTTDNFSAITQIATGTFTVNSTLTQYSVQIALPALAANGVQIVLGSATQTSGTLRIGNVQLEKGVTATAFDYRPFGTELALCQRYLPAYSYNSSGTAGYEQIGSGYWTSSTSTYIFVPHPVNTRVPPTGLVIDAASQFLNLYTTNLQTTGITWTATAGVRGSLIAATATGGAAGGGVILITKNNGGLLYFTGCEL